VCVCVCVCVCACVCVCVCVWVCVGVLRYVDTRPIRGVQQERERGKERKRESGGGKESARDRENIREGSGRARDSVVQPGHTQTCSQ